MDFITIKQPFGMSFFQPPEANLSNPKPTEWDEGEGGGDVGFFEILHPL